MLKFSSINLRLTSTTLLVLVVFLGLIGYLLQSAQRSSLESSVESQLLGHVYALLGEVQEGQQGGVKLPKAVADPRLNRPDSGLYAELNASSGSVHWRSGSLIGMSVPPVESIAAGKQRFYEDTSAYRLLYGFGWEGLDGALTLYTLRVSLERKLVDRQTGSFQTVLWSGLGGLGLLLLIVQGLVLRWGLLPLSWVSQDLKAIENGEADKLRGDYPKELKPLTGNINSLLEHNRIQQERYRNSLDDLAHSIKTPLAVLQGALDASDPSQLEEAARQAVPHIDDIVRGRLHRAALGGGSALSNKVPLFPLAQRLINTLDKVYRDRQLQFENHLPEQIQFPGDENDYMELLGNLLENACKYGHSKVKISAVETDDVMLKLVIEDDGPGISEDEVKQVLSRGGRLDEQHPGQGIGLAAVREIVRLYKGSLDIGKSQGLGGAAISISLPVQR